MHARNSWALPPLSRWFESSVPPWEWADTPEQIHAIALVAAEGSYAGSLALLGGLVKMLASTSEMVLPSPRATLLTLLRLTTNALGMASLSCSLLLPAGAHDARVALTSVLAQTLTGLCAWRLLAWRSTLMPE